MSGYARLEREAGRPKPITDHRDAWERLTPLLGINGTARQRVEAFCESKRISIEALIALGTRVKVDGHGGVELAWGYQAPRSGAVTAVKFRPLGDKRRYALNPSTFLQPLVVGRRDSLDWFVAEGETDGARLFGLVGDVAAVLVLPAGALTFKREWAAAVPRGARVFLAHDADDAGDQGADKAAHILGGRTVRLRPPIEEGDWCDWEGGRDEFVALAQTTQAQERAYEFAPMGDFLEHRFPDAEALLGEIILAVGALLLVYGAEGSAKSTWSMDGVAHMAAGRDWLGIPVPRPVRFCLIENEGPPALFQAKLAAKAASWDEPADWQDNVFVFRGPWGEFSFAEPAARDALNEFCDEHDVDVVVANPTLGLGVAGSGRPDETQQFVDWLVECGLKSTRAFWLLHHENKAGQISGDWGRHPDTKVQLQRDGNQPRTKLIWEKTRWATLPSDTTPKACLLDWIIETQGYTVTELDTVGASDAELQQRIADYLADHPLSNTRTVWANVKGTNDRISKLLKGDRFDCLDGPNNAKLWLLTASDSATSDESPNHQAEIRMDIGNE